MKTDYILKIANIFENLALKKVAVFTIYQVSVLAEGLSDILHKNISEELVEEWADINPIIKSFPRRLYQDSPNSLSDSNATNSANLISTSEEEPDNLKSTTPPMLLKGIGDIPDMYYHKGDVIEINESLQNIPKEFAHYAFILLTISALLKRDFFEDVYYHTDNVDNEMVEIFSNFMSKNKSAVDRILSSGSKLPALLGVGYEGVAFDIGNNMVLKFTNEPSTYKKMLEQMNILHEIPDIGNTEAMVYDAGLVGNVEANSASMPLYYIIIEKMQPVKSLPISLQNYLGFINKIIASEIRNNYKIWQPLLPIFKNIKENKDKLPEAINELKQLAFRISNKADLMVNNDSFIANDVAEFDEFTEENKLKDNWMDKYVEEILFKMMTQRGDLHSGNLGLTNNGEFRFFDSYHKSWEDELNLQ